jgi:hypothetical protein
MFLAEHQPEVYMPLTGLPIPGRPPAAGSSLVRAKLYGVSPLDPLGFATGLALLAKLAAVALLAAVVPASAALRVDPAATLRHE